MEALEQNLTTYKERYQQNLNAFKSRMGDLNNQKSALSTQNKELENKVAALQKDIDSQQGQQGSAQNVADEATLVS